MARDFWRQGFEFQRFTSFSSSTAVLSVLAILPNLNAVERDLITQALTECAGNKSQAAARLGISRTQLYVRLRRYQLS